MGESAEETTIGLSIKDGSWQAAEDAQADKTSDTLGHRPSGNGGWKETRMITLAIALVWLALGYLILRWNSSRLFAAWLIGTVGFIATALTKHYFPWP